MQDLLTTLNDATPIIIIVSIALFMTLEKALPYFEHSTARGRQRWRNLGMVLFAFIVNAVVSGSITAVVMASEKSNFGLLHRLLGQSWVAIGIGILLIDLINYSLHVTLHKVPALWRIHRVHHADTEMDATSGLRLHPLELGMQLAVQSILLPLLGISMASLIFYFTFALPWFIVIHANLKFPDWFERFTKLVLVTPNWHRIHHSDFQEQTDSNYGCVFSFWDRIFGTRQQADVEKIQFGLERFRNPAEQSVWNLLKMPFRK